MTADPHPPPSASRPVVDGTVVDGHAVLVLSGEFHPHDARSLEERLTDPRLHAAGRWVLELEDVTRLDLVCAFALMRTVSALPRTTDVHIRGARRNVRRTLHEAGLDAVAVFDA
ncbi:STAS domain-containing protein [Streptomyces coeruleoprunus]|uniref:STAS domain-containing protein n=1 Tax=Streptomyces coeruleoprunus TaxID=285563 RepID=A0ABV9XFQ6_9ACTN